MSRKIPRKTSHQTKNKNSRIRTADKNRMNKLFPISEEFFRNVVDSLEDYAVFTTDTKGKVNSWNSGAERLLGYSETKIIGKNFRIFFTPGAKKNKVPEKELATAAKNGTAFDERFYTRKNKLRFWGSGQVFPLKDEKGTVRGFTKIIRNMSEEMLAAGQLSQLAAIVDSSDDAIISRDLKGIITTWNKGAERLFGFTAEEAIGEHVSITMPSGFTQETVKPETLSQRNSIPIMLDTVRQKKDRSLFNVSVTVSPMKDEKGKLTGASIIARDITERKFLERQKDEFIGIASHELKTPVTSVKAYTQVLRNRFRKVHDIRSVELIQKLDSQIDKLTMLINDLLDVTKLEGGKLQLHAEYFDFNELVTEIVEEMQRTTDTHTMVTKLARSRTLYGDRDRIGQVLTNLLSNAIKYSPNAEKIIIESDSDSKHVTLCVRDFGMGISKKKQKQVFERFYRVSGPKGNTFPGLGLGLYISSEIVKRQGGRIWVESEGLKGSRFCFRLPVRLKKKSD